jgi:hypothetical protein
VTATVQGCSDLHGNLTSKCSARVTMSGSVGQSQLSGSPKPFHGKGACLNDALASALLFVREDECLRTAPRAA